LKYRIELFAIGPPHRGCRIGRRDSVRIPVTDDHFGPDEIHDAFEQTRSPDPERDFEPCGPRCGARSEVDEADFTPKLGQ
jgi:hypothetical protein